MENFEIHGEMMATSADMLEACYELEARAEIFARAHTDFKRERAKAMVASTEKTDKLREAKADMAVENYRFENYLAEGMLQAQLERVRCLRTKLSALQTNANMQKEAAAFERTGQNQQT